MESETEYWRRNRETFLSKYGAAALPQIWRIVCSCGASSESRWKDHQSLFMQRRAHLDVRGVADR
jgi:hypothetical protein